MRYLIAVLLLVSAGVITFVSAKMNMLQASGMSADNTVAFLWGMAAVAADMVKILVPFAVAMITVRKIKLSPFEWWALRVLLLACITLSSVSATANMVEQHAIQVANRQAAKDRASAHDARRAELSSKIKKAVDNGWANNSPVSIARQIDDLLARELVYRRGRESVRGATKNCTNMKRAGPKTRGICANVAALRVQLNRATRLALWKTELQRLPEPVNVPQNVDKTGFILAEGAKALGVDMEPSGGSMVFILVLVFVFEAAPIVASSLAGKLVFRAKTGRTARKSKLPFGELTDFVEAELATDKESETPAKDIYAKYQEWAKSTKTDTLSQTKFGKLLSQYFAKTKRKGRVVYRGIAILEA